MLQVRGFQCKVKDPSPRPEIHVSRSNSLKTENQNNLNQYEMQRLVVEQERLSVQHMCERLPASIHFAFKIVFLHKLPSRRQGHQPLRLFPSSHHLPQASISKHWKIEKQNPDLWVRVIQESKTYICNPQSLLG